MRLESTNEEIKDNRFVSRNFTIAINFAILEPLTRWLDLINLPTGHIRLHRISDKKGKVDYLILGKWHNLIKEIDLVDENNNYLWNFLIVSHVE